MKVYKRIHKVQRKNAKIHTGNLKKITAQKS